MNKTETTKWCVLVAPAIRKVGDEYVECEAVFCYDNTERNPAVYWSPDINYGAAYTCGDFSYVGVKRYADNKEYLKTLQKRGGIVEVVIDEYRIIEVTKTVNIEETHRVVEMSRLK